MNEFPLNFRKFSDECPSDGQEIFFIENDNFYGSYEIRYGTVEHQWEEYDDEGHPTGTTFVIEEGESPPPNTSLKVLVDQCLMQDGMLWVACTAVDAMLEASQKLEVTL